MRAKGEEDAEDQRGGREGRREASKAILERLRYQDICWEEGRSEEREEEPTRTKESRPDIPILRKKLLLVLFFSYLIEV